MVGAGVKYPCVAASGTESPYFGAGGMLAHTGKAGADGDVRDGVEANDVNDGDAVCGSGDIRMETQAGAKE
ncbi:MAG: hypothetical protein PVS2B2_13640 [Candidatus Acidiferrum sp.]